MLNNNIGKIGAIITGISVFLSMIFGLFTKTIFASCLFADEDNDKRLLV